MRSILSDEEDTSQRTMITRPRSPINRRRFSDDDVLVADGRSTEQAGSEGHWNGVERGRGRNNDSGLSVAGCKKGGVGF
jgi:hypothetical protein